MATKRRRRNLLPEEELVARLLPGVFAGAVVEQHDDGSEDGMYDLRLRGPFDAAVEVGQVTDEAIREAKGHWAKHLQRHRTTDLRLCWSFKFSDEAGPDEATRYPRVSRPPVHDLTGVLARLETKGIERVGRWWEHAVFEPGGWRMSDPDIAALFDLLGPAAEDASSVDLSHHGEPGGWEFAFAFGHTSTNDPNQFAASIEALLQEESREDMRDKLNRSGRPVRIAALVFDSTTSAGWTTRHLTGDIAPTMAVQLPAAITHVLVVGMNDLALLFSDRDGWSRHHPSSCPVGWCRS